MEYFCAAKPQNCDLKTVQGAKRLVLERLVTLNFTLPQTLIETLEIYNENASLPKRDKKIPHFKALTAVAPEATNYELRKL